MRDTLSREVLIELAEPSAYRSARERTARLLDKTIFFALLATITLTAVPYGTVEPWWEALFECAVLTLGALWIIEGLLSGTWRSRGDSLLAPLVGFVVFAWLQTLPVWGGDASVGAAGIENAWQAISADPYETRRLALKLIALTLAGQLLLRYTSSPGRLRTLVHVVIGIGVASALFGILRQTTERGAPGFILPGLASDASYGQFINRNHFALLMEMTLGLVLGLVAGGGAHRRHGLLIYLAAALPVWAALVLTTSRGGIFGMFSQLLLLALLFGVVRPSRETARQGGGKPSGWRRIGGSFVARGALILGVVAAMLVGVVWMGGDQLVSRLEAMPDQFGTKSVNEREGESRIEVWQATWQLIKANPLVGVGFGGYRAAITEHHDASGELTPQDAHNDYLELLASGGLVGALLAAWFVVAFFGAARGRLRSADSFRRAACYGAMAGLCGVAVHSLVDYGLHITINAVVCLTLVVIAVADDNVEEKRWRGGEMLARL